MRNALLYLYTTDRKIRSLLYIAIFFLVYANVTLSSISPGKSMQQIIFKNIGLSFVLIIAATIGYSFVRIRMGQDIETLDKLQRLLSAIEVFPIESTSGQPLVRDLINPAHQLLGLMKLTGNKEGEVAALRMLGNAYFANGKFAESVKYQDRSLAACESEDYLNQAHALFNLSLSFFQLNDREQAIKDAVSAFHLYLEINAPESRLVAQQLQKWGVQISASNALAASAG